MVIKKKIIQIFTIDRELVIEYYVYVCFSTKKVNFNTLKMKNHVVLVSVLICFAIGNELPENKRPEKRLLSSVKFLDFHKDLTEGSYLSFYDI